MSFPPLTFIFFAVSNLYFRVGSHETLFTQAFEKLIIPFVTNGVRSASISKCKLLLHMYIKNLTLFILQTDLGQRN